MKIKKSTIGYLLVGGGVGILHDGPFWELVVILGFFVVGLSLIFVERND